MNSVVINGEWLQHVFLVAEKLKGQKVRILEVIYDFLLLKNYYLI